MPTLGGQDRDLNAVAREATPQRLSNRRLNSVDRLKFGEVESSKEEL
jgi:hypothetical protein